MLIFLTDVTRRGWRATCYCSHRASSQKYRGNYDTRAHFSPNINHKSDLIKTRLNAIAKLVSVHSISNQVSILFRDFVSFAVCGDFWISMRGCRKKAYQELEATVHSWRCKRNVRISGTISLEANQIFISWRL